jgi:hypothetical protein
LIFAGVRAICLKWFFDYTHITEPDPNEKSVPPGGTAGLGIAISGRSLSF